ncbi:hypothetical protein [Aurantiacibacter sp. D1-12]|uniref:hypothetical protein n=1 Tax=Aurantiacibacter sp. D1-12 TaxID=2993658 RepID=UPI00237C6177|nr:hypothetical protein [Aurantiacibacter sp. D1-12]MDE1467735.1 hypothetical protein [Aurantiacibacter sp. D1-12]
MFLPPQLARSLGATLTACSLSLLALPAAAQDAGDPEGDNTIIVEGTLDQETVRNQARDITNRRGTTSEPLSRFNRPICPGVWGLQPENAQLVIDRIYDNAERAGAQLGAEAGCSANLWVIFVDDPHATFAQLRDENAFLVRGLNVWQRNRVAEQQGPTIAWSTSEISNSDGITAAPDSPTNENYTMSRLDTGVRKDMLLSVVLIDRSVLGELDAYAVADYATMRLLAETRPPEEGAEFNTILSLFDGDMVSETSPLRMSAFDRAYLQDLYRGRGTTPANRAHSGVGALMEQELVREYGEASPQEQ